MLSLFRVSGTALLRARFPNALARTAAAASPPQQLLPPLPVHHSRGYATSTRRRRKEMARERAAHTRSLLSVAALYDPMRTAKLEFAQTLDRLGWQFNAGEMISDGVVVDFSMREHYCAFTLVEEKHYVPAGHPDASTTPAMPPFPRDAAGQIVLPHESAHPAAPAPWDNPVLGKFLDVPTARFHAMVQSKGWALIAIPLPLWQIARGQEKNQHESRRDLLLQLCLPRVPFESRPVLKTGAVSGTTMTGSAKAARHLADAEAAAASATSGNVNRSRASRAAYRMAESAAAGGAGRKAGGGARAAPLRKGARGGSGDLDAPPPDDEFGGAAAAADEEEGPPADATSSSRPTKAAVAVAGSVKAGGAKKKTSRESSMRGRGR